MNKTFLVIMFELVDFLNFSICARRVFLLQDFHLFQKNTWWWGGGNRKEPNFINKKVFIEVIVNSIGLVSVPFYQQNKSVKNLTGLISNSHLT